MKYILIWWVWASGTATGSVEFETRQACEAAAQAITQRVGIAQPGVQARCFEKGQRQ